MSKPIACVLGEIDLVRALGLAGIRSAVVSPPGDLARYSRFTRARLDLLDPRRRPEELVELLLGFGRSQPSKPVLYYDGDAGLLLVSRFRDELRTAFRFVVPDAAFVETAVDKELFQKLAGTHDLPVPPTVRLAELAGIGDVALRYPVVVKPLARQLTAWDSLSSGKVIEIETAAELEALWPRLEGAGIDVLVQELVPGPESLIESYHAYADEDGVIVGEFTGKKIRTFPTAHGYSTAVVVTDAADVAELGRDIFRRLEVRGVAKIDFKRHPDDGRLYLLEINPRFNLWHHVGARAGVNLPALVYRDLVGLPRAPAVEARPGVTWCNPWRDAQAAWTQNVPLRRWLPWALSCQAKSAVAWDDPFPLLGAIAHRAVRKLDLRRRELEPAG